MTGKVIKSRRSSVKPSAKAQKPSPKPSKRKAASMGKEARAHWLSRDAWNKRELMDFLCGLEPDQSRPSTEATNRASEEICRAVETDKLVPVLRSGATPGDVVFDNHQLFEPSAAIRWATSTLGRFPHFPFTAEDILPRQSMDQPLNKKERTSLHLIIAALAGIAKVDLANPYKAGGVVQNAMNDLAAAQGLSSNCIGDHLKRASATANPSGVPRKQR